MVDREYLVQPDNPTMIGWGIVLGCTGIQVLGRSPVRGLFLP